MSARNPAAALGRVRTGKLGTPLRLSEDTHPEMIRNRNGSPVAKAVSVDVALTLIEYANERDELLDALRQLRDAWNAHMATCPQHAALPVLPGPSQADLDAWRDAPERDGLRMTARNDSAATESREQHTLSFEDFDLRVQVDTEGNVWRLP